MILGTKEAEKHYGRTRALQGVTFDIAPGNIYALLGPNGSGKTTWMKMAAALVKPSAGGILFAGTPVCAKTRAQIVYLPTEDFFYSWMRVGDVHAVNRHAGKVQGGGGAVAVCQRLSPG